MWLFSHHLFPPLLLVNSLGTSALAALEAKTDSEANDAFPWGEIEVLTERIQTLDVFNKKSHQVSDVSFK